MTPRSPSPPTSSRPRCRWSSAPTASPRIRPCAARPTPEPEAPAPARSNRREQKRQEREAAKPRQGAGRPPRHQGAGRREAAWCDPHLLLLGHQGAPQGPVARPRHARPGLGRHPPLRRSRRRLSRNSRRNLQPPHRPTDLDGPPPPLQSTKEELQSMFRWYVINTYSGHENKVKHNLEHRVQTMGQARKVRQVVVPTEQVQEIKDGRKVNVEKRTMPGYVLVQMEMTDEAWGLVKNTPGVTGFVGSRNKPLPLSQTEVDNLLHTETPGAAAAAAGGARAEAERRRARSRAPSTRSGRPSRSSPARCPISPARSPRSTTTRRSSRSWSRSSVARPPSRSATTRSRRFRRRTWPRKSSP